MITWYICNTKASGKVDIFVITTREPERFYIEVVQNRGNKPLQFLHNIIRSVPSVFRIAEMKQESMCWLYQSEIHHSNLHNVTNGVQLIKRWNRTVHFFYYSAADIVF